MKAGLRWPGEVAHNRHAPSPAGVAAMKAGLDGPAKLDHFNNRGRSVQRRRNEGRARWPGEELADSGTPDQGERSVVRARAVACPANECPKVVKDQKVVLSCLRASPGVWASTSTLATTIRGSLPRSWVMAGVAP